MTLQQQAYGLIDRLPDDSVQVVIQVMRRMLPHEVKVKHPSQATRGTNCKDESLLADART